MRFEGCNSVAETPSARIYQNTAYESFGSQNHLQHQSGMKNSLSAAASKKKLSVKLMNSRTMDFSSSSDEEEDTYDEAMSQFRSFAVLYPNSKVKAMNKPMSELDINSVNL